MRRKKTPPKGVKPPQLIKHQFKPGQSGNPKGRPLNPIPTVLRELTIDSYRKVIEAVCTGNVDNLRKMLDDPNISALQVAVAASVLKAIREGNYEVVERIAQRIVGKIPDELNINSKTQSMNLNVNAALDESKMKMAFTKLQEEI